MYYLRVPTSCDLSGRLPAVGASNPPMTATGRDLPHADGSRFVSLSGGFRGENRSLIGQQPPVRSSNRSLHSSRSESDVEASRSQPEDDGCEPDRSIVLTAKLIFFATERQRI